MAAAIDFYFDFSSPYGYIAAAKVEALAAKHGRGVNWRPMLLGAAMKVTGGAPLPQIPLKGDYAKRDFVRSAKFHGVPFRIPSSFPISTIAAVRAFYWAQGKDPARALALAKALYSAYFADDVDISRVEEVIRIAAGVGFKAGGCRSRRRGPGSQGQDQGRGRRGGRQGRIRFALHRHRRRSVLGHGPARSGREMARHGRLVI